MTTTNTFRKHRPLLPIANAALAIGAITISVVAITTDHPTSTHRPAIDQLHIDAPARKEATRHSLQVWQMSTDDCVKLPIRATPIPC
jgi:hypothetical protein